MDTISVVFKGENKTAKVIRYFAYNNQNYLVISFDEEDQNGYKKLYVCKVINGIEGLATIGILDEAEYENVKNVIKTIIKEVKDNMLVTVTDLNYKELNNIVINQTRAFRLLPNVVEVFSSNKKVFEEKVVEEPIVEQTIEQAVELDYKDLYFKEIEDKKAILEQLNTANEEIAKYKNKLDSIKNLIEQ